MPDRLKELMLTVKEELKLGFDPYRVGETSHWRELLLKFLLGLGLFLGPVALVTGLVYAFETDNYWLAAGGSTAFLAFMALLFARKLPFRLLAALCCLLIFLVGFLALLIMGPVSSGAAYLFCFPIITGMLLGIPAALAALALNLAVLVLETVLLVMGHYPDAMKILGPTTHWLASSAGFFFLNALSSLSAAVLVQGLESAVFREARAKKDLEEEMERRSQAEDELRHREEWLRTIFEHTGTAMMIIDQNGTLVMLNEKASEITGFSREELEGKAKWHKFVSPADMPRMMDYSQRRYMGDETVPRSYEFILRDKNGRERNVLNNVETIPGSGMLVVSVIDITERKRAEEALARSEARYRDLLGSIPNPVVVYDAQGKAIFLNEAFQSIYGWTLTDMSSNAGAFVPPGEEEKSARGWRSFLTTDRVVFETQRRTKDGRLLDIEISGTRLLNQDGGYDGAVVVHRDITQQKRAVEALRASEEKFSKAFQESPIWVVLSHLETGRYLEVNQSFLDTMGYRREEVLGRTSVELNAWVDLEDRRRLVEAVRNTGRVRNMEVKRRSRDGRVLTMLLSGEMIEIGGEPCLLSVSQDITDIVRIQEEFRHSEERFRTAFEAAPLGMALVDLNRCFLKVNQRLCEILGYAPEELLGRDFNDFTHPGDKEGGPRRFERILQGMDRYNAAEKRYVHKDGRAVWVHASNALVTDDKGRPLHFVCHVQDITQRKMAEQAKRESEETARAILEASPHPIVVYDNNGGVLYMNPSFSRVFGWELNEVAGRRIPFVPEEEMNTTMETIGLLYQGKGPVSFDTRRLTRDGRVLEVTISAAEVRDEGGKAVGMVVNLTDVTQRNQTQKALARSERRYRDLVDNISDFIYTHDLEGRFLSVNRAAAESLGYDSKDLAGKFITDMMLPEYKREFNEQYLETLKTKGHIEGLSIYLDYWGNKHYIEYRSFLVKDLDGTVHVQGSGRDVTERLMSEREQRKLEEQLFQAQKMQALGTLTGGVAHDFNNLLTGLMSNLGLALAKLGGDNPAVPHIKSAATVAERAGRVTQQLLTISRKAERQIRPVDLGRVVRDTVAFLADTLDRRIEVRVDLAPDLPPVNADEAQMNQVIMNLVVNARDALVDKLPSSGEAGGGRQEENLIRVSAGAVDLSGEGNFHHAMAYPGRFVVLTVQDTGVGIEEGVRERVFDPFFTTKGPGEGTGLGLSTVYSIVDQHRGWIEVESKPGKGATFRVFLPALAPGTLETEEVPEPGPLPQGRETILMVDDEPPILDTAAEFLSGLGYRVITARDGREALDVFEEKAAGLDLMVLDLTMPRLSGQEVLAIIREKAPGLPVIISSGHGEMPPEEAGGGDKGLLAFLPKPYRLNELAKAVRSLLDGIS